MNFKLRITNSPVFFCFLLLFVAASQAWARPYYAAKKGLSCSACHMNPAGGGARPPTLTSPTRINDSINLGADLRLLGRKAQGTPAANPSTFNLFETSVYLMANPSENLHLVYENNQAQTAQAYGIWNSKGFALPVYVRAGRFFIPYGLQTDELDQSSYIKNPLFAPSVGFSMFSSQSDTGLEVGFNPDERYFLNVAATNGTPGGAAATNNSKAWTSRVGFILPYMGAGLSGFRNHPLGIANALETRGSLFGWIHWNRFVLLGEYGRGTNTPNDPTQPNARKEAAYAELDVDALNEILILKTKFDYADPNTALSNDSRNRYTIAVEWLPLPGSAIEAQYRFLQETPKLKNNEAILAGHIWF